MTFRGDRCQNAERCRLFQATVSKFILGKSTLYYVIPYSFKKFKFVFLLPIPGGLGKVQFKYKEQPSFPRASLKNDNSVRVGHFLILWAAS